MKVDIEKDGSLTTRLLLGQSVLMFMGLKLGGVIDWSWWWVFAPLWMPLAAGYAFAAIGFFAGLAKGDKK